MLLLLLEITVQEGILTKDKIVIIPSALRLNVLDKIHTGHQGIQKFPERIKSGVLVAESPQADRRPCQRMP